MLQKIINRLNDLRPRQLLILALAAAFLMFVSLIIGMNLMTKQEVAIIPEEPKEEQPIIEMTKVVVAKVNIPPRTRIQENMLEMKEVPNTLMPEGAITNFDDVKNVQIQVSIFAGDILTVQKVFNAKAEEGFLGSIPSDCRAVSINVNEVTGVAGFAKPGDKVDLLLVEKTDHSATSSLLLQNVPLISVNQDTAGNNIVDDNGIVKSSAISNPTIATFALPPQDILKLISASKLGEVYMMLRPSHPQETYVAEMEYTMESISSPRPEAAQVPAIPANPTPNVPLPQIPEMPVAPAAPKFDIIMGDELTQDSKESAKEAAKAPANSALPAIPSGNAAPKASVPSPVQNTPFEGSPIMKKIGN